MKTEINKKNGSNLIVMIFAITMLFVTILGTSLAWFTDKKDLEGNGTTPYISVTVKNGVNNDSTSSGKDTVSTTATISKTIGEANSIVCPVNATINSNINVLVRMFITINWQDNTINGQYGGTEVVVPNFGTNWLSTSTGSNYDKMKEGFLYYNTEIKKNENNEPIPLFGELLITNRFGNINGQVVNVSVYVEAVQANSEGLDKWRWTKDKNGNWTENTLPKTINNMYPTKHTGN